VTAVLLAASIVAACTGTSTDPVSPTSVDQVVLPPVPVSASSLPGRLLVLDGGGGLVTLRPDGSDRVQLARGTPGVLDVTGAAWAPDGERVVWAQVDRGEKGTSSRLVTTTSEGTGRRDTILHVPIIYLSWDPTSSRVAFLGAGPNGLRLSLLDATGGGKHPVAHRLDAGPTYYFSWSPNGERMLVHVGPQRLDELGVDGSRRVVERAPGVFQAPVWSRDGSTFVYPVRSGEGMQTLVTRAAAGGPTTSIDHVDGVVSFVVSSDGRQVAYQALGPDELDLYDRDLPQRATNVGVTIADLRTGERLQLTTQPAVAFSWSPDGSRLAVLEPIYQPTGTIFFRWVVWDGTDAFTTAAFSPALALLQAYAPFFSQYAQSVSMWAPDGSAFAYPADVAVGPPVIWVQPAEPDTDPFPVGRGTFVAWSPAA
jgi:TolB protein